ncbi:GPP34 family phosphoprotein [Kribbella sp. NPDC051770]|uniref:GOLPH3/VPS74 family protein n=1 Tax=Kribbella sp. NPDC051770 TaxID=3155413 RepID=UPI00341D3AEF
MDTETLIVEDLLLLLLDDETGTPAGAGTLHYTLGGAVLVELALRGAIESDESRALNGAKITAVEGKPQSDPLLQAAYEKILAKPRRIQPLLLDVGAGLWKPLVERLIERGLIRRERKKVLGLFRMTQLPATSAEHEGVLRQQLRAVLEDNATPDARIAALIALLSASGALPVLRPPLAWSGEVAKRAQQIQQGDWAASAVSTAVTRTAAAIAASSAAVAISVVTTNT